MYDDGMTTTETPTKGTTIVRPRWLLPVLILYSAIAVTLLGPAALMAMMSPMMSDSGLNIVVWAMILGALLAPLVLLASLITAWVGFAKARLRLAIGAMCAPLVWLAYMIVVFLAANLMELG